MNIDLTKPSREIDQLIAEKIFDRRVEMREFWVYDDFNDHMTERLEMLIKIHPRAGIFEINGEIFTDETWEEWDELPYYSLNFTAVQELESKIKEFNLVSKYLNLLEQDIMKTNPGSSLDDLVYKIVWATPLQRCVAALKSMKVVENA